MLPILAALSLLAVTGVISSWYVVFAVLVIACVKAFIFFNVWAKFSRKRRQNAFRVHRGPTIDI